MTKTSALLFLAAFIFILNLVAGCADPNSNPIQPPPTFLDGVALEINNGIVSPSASGKPYLITEDWIIGPNETVTIQPGTEFIFDGLHWVDVQGKLIANGTSTQPIHFSSAYLAKDLGQWRGIKLHNNTEVSEIRYCIFTYGAYFDQDTSSERGRDAQNYKGMLGVNNCSPIIEHCIAMFNQNNGIYIQGSDSRPQIHYNIFTQNDAAGIRSDSSARIIEIETSGGISYNCVSDNSSPSFLGSDTNSVLGIASQENANLDSVDAYFNMDKLPEMLDPENGLFQLESCSPCVDSGPANGGTDPDGTRIDMGVLPYVQVAGELRGVISGTLDPNIAYRMSCHIRVPSGEQLIVPAGTHIECTGFYNFEVRGHLDIQGTPENRVQISPSVGNSLWFGFIFSNLDEASAPSEVTNADIMNYQSIMVQKTGARFDGVRFMNGYDLGAEVTTGSLSLQDTVSFQNCEFLSCGVYGLRVDSSSAAIRNCLVSGSSGRGISLENTGASAFVTNTVINACSTSALAIQDFSSPWIQNNTILQCGYYGINLSDNCYPNIKNNIVAWNYRYGILAELQSAPALSYNDFFDNYTAGSTPRNYQPDTLTAANSLDANPLFISTTDFHLSAGSPCINAGDEDSQYNDADGSRNDIGAYGGPGASLGIGTTTNYLNNNRLAAK